MGAPPSIFPASTAAAATDAFNCAQSATITPEQQRWAAHKKYWYLITFLVPTLTVASALMALQSGSGQWFWLITLIFYVVVPVVDFIMGSDSFNPDAEQEKQLATDSRYYTGVLYAATAGQWLGLFVMTYAVTQGDWSLFNILGAIVSVGCMHAIGLTMSHELGHKLNDKQQVLAAKICSAVSGYAHFNIEHNKGHHKDVSTPEDPASSRMGESLYKFALRELPGAAQRGWTLEAERLQRQKRSIFSTHNELLHVVAITAIGYGVMIALCGWIALPFLLITAALGWFQLTLANYIEHYGLLREKKADGRYERCQPHHSWNSNYKASNLLTLHLQRHSDHHAHPTRAYQFLRDYKDAPQLPHGYPAMMAMAMIPPAWKAIMDPRVVQWAKGDMNKVNLDPAQREALFAQYHHPASVTP